MPCLAPIGTPAANPPIDSHEPVWQSSLAFMSVGSAFTFGRPRASSDSPCSADALVNSVDSLEHTPSTQWSTARMPVERNSHIGVCRVTSGSRITACGMVSGSRRVRRHFVEGADAFVAQRTADLLDFVGLAIERAAHHQEHAFDAELLD